VIPRPLLAEKAQQQRRQEHVEVPAGSAAHLPPAPLAVLVPAASAAILLALRERLEREREAMRVSALTDGLTGVANRRSVLARTEYEILRHQRAERPFGVLMLDLDGFKALNDRFGHAAGDELLRDVAAAITEALRDQDTVARMGGDEFCVLAPETDIDGTRQLADRVQVSIAQVTVGLDRVGASIGAAVFRLVPGNIADILFDAGGFVDPADKARIEAELVQEGGVEVVNGRHLLNGLVAELIGGAVAVRFLDAGAGQPDREPLGIVVAALRSLLKGGHAAELRGPHDERIVEGKRYLPQAISRHELQRSCELAGHTQAKSLAAHKQLLSLVQSGYKIAEWERVALDGLIVK